MITFESELLDILLIVVNGTVPSSCVLSNGYIRNVTLLWVKCLHCELAIFLTDENTLDIGQYFC